MRIPRPLALLHRALALGLMALVLLAGVERGVLGAPTDATGVAGFIGPICHASGAGGMPDSPGAPSGHDCCDECALAAAALVPTAPQLSEPARFSFAAAHQSPAAMFASGRPWTPRQPQGPPVA